MSCKGGAFALWLDAWTLDELAAVNDPLSTLNEQTQILVKGIPIAL